MQNPIHSLSASPSASHPAVSSRPTANDSSSPSSSSDSGDATITSNDFLQLLVTEMKNQDPTATTDPNEYIDQLVQVNSLQQLIQINQDLGSVTSGSSGGSGDTAGTPAFMGNLGSNQSSRPDVSAAASGVASALGPKPESSVKSAASQFSQNLHSNVPRSFNVQ